MAPFAYEFRGNDGRDRDRVRDDGPIRDKQRRRDGDRNRPPQHQFTFRFTPKPTSERPLLSRQRETTPELLGSHQDGHDKLQLKFAHPDELTDSDEADMEESSSEDDDSDSNPPRKKRAVQPAPTAAVVPPKWSNPDPYTALPPPDETQTKRPDFVKLIRKARIAAASGPLTGGDAVTTNEDFISFGTEDDDLVDENLPPVNAPSGPKNNKQRVEDVGAGKKRTRDDQVKVFTGKFGKVGFTPQGDIISVWKARPSDNQTPWLELMEPTMHLGTRLHNEILAFYDWVKPRPYEDMIRKDLIQRIQYVFDSQPKFRGMEVQSFGSFASGLYLPVADMDLVLLSPNFRRYGRESFIPYRRSQGGRISIYEVARVVERAGVIVSGSMEIISGARVPILKWVDRLTGLRVDMAFDNDSGIRAIQTFKKWREAYPAMPAIVAIVKQFLLLRSLNEVPTGGLGGFSIICLVVSLLQHMPHRLDGHGPSLGSVLMDFFDFYGNKFDFSSVGIRMEPPGYFNKVVYNHEKKARLSIEDPNRPENDISVGTKEIGLVFRCFSKAYDDLKSRMTLLATSQNQTKVCFLDTIISACYDEYTDQRAHLRSIFENEARFIPYLRMLTPPPPPPDSPSESEYDPEHAPVPPPPPVPTNSEIKIKGISSSNSSDDKVAIKRQKKQKKKGSKQKKQNKVSKKT
ncbi:hypothetical protein UA08_00721 [Talaromyces atroroseus]|uniref:polynucleotide adenylyltransferase n=1 Tax=Talaromyces atroroseus TaxID=1441469 RepID=A0A225ARG1_TALAT|nr:hypothetical protein UA08_00721 [Talaromyces atroroseus]OKL64171.1 hypothetical protein UA08_00721 [Talaromyces atroroseus]